MNNPLLTTSSELDMGRGTALLVAGAVMVLLTWVVPQVAPIALAGYGVYQLVQKRWREGVVFLVIALIFWVLRGPIRWLLWLVGALMVGFGLFFLIRGLRNRAGQP